VPKVVVAEDDLLVREGIAALLSTEPGYDVVGRFGDAAGVLEHLRGASCDVVVTDIRMPPTHTDEGIRLAHELRQFAPEVGVVVLSQFLEPDFALALLDDGDAARGYLLKEHIGDPSTLFAAIEAVVAGETWVDPAVVEALVPDRPTGPLSRLTQREIEVLGEVAKGRSNAAIAQTLSLSERSVEKHVASIMMKLDIFADQSTNRRVSAALTFLAHRGRP
jgi:DNA-binding NarL/FixJ family response regulator